VTLGGGGCAGGPAVGCSSDTFNNRRKLRYISEQTPVCWLADKRSKTYAGAFHPSISCCSTWHTCLDLQPTTTTTPYPPPTPTLLFFFSSSASRACSSRNLQWRGNEARSTSHPPKYQACQLYSTHVRRPPAGLCSAAGTPYNIHRTSCCMLSTRTTHVCKW
jgi:hypothetical protein